MTTPPLEAKSLDSPEETRPFTDKGTVDLVTVGGVTVGRGVVEPGWRWSEHARPLAGDAFHIPPGHAAWTVGSDRGPDPGRWSEPAPRTGDPAPDLALEDADGRRVALAELWRIPASSVSASRRSGDPRASARRPSLADPWRVRHRCLRDPAARLPLPVLRGLHRPARPPHGDPRGGVALG